MRRDEMGTMPDERVATMNRVSTKKEVTTPKKR
jgi:hypothetical protein